MGSWPPFRNLSHHIGSIWRGKFWKRTSLLKNQKLSSLSNQFDLALFLHCMESSFRFQRIHGPSSFILLTSGMSFPIPRAYSNCGHRYPQIPKMVLLLCIASGNSLTIYMLYRFVNFDNLKVVVWVFTNPRRKPDTVMESLACMALFGLFSLFSIQKRFFKV